MTHSLRSLAVGCALLAAAAPSSAQDAPRRTEVAPPRAGASARPFGTQRDLAALQQQWLSKRLDTFVPGLMRKHGIDFWVVTMREYKSTMRAGSKPVSATGKA